MNKNKGNMRYNIPNMRLGILLDSSEEKLILGYDSAPEI